MTQAGIGPEGCVGAVARLKSGANVCLAVISFAATAAADSQSLETARNPFQPLFEAGAPPYHSLGADSHGMPLWCGSRLAAQAAADQPRALANPASLPPGTRSWECIPGVILNDGVDAFRLEVNVGGPVSNVTLEVWTPLIAESGTGTLSLRDDGLNGDRAAGDYVFTSERLMFDTRQQWQHPPYYQRDTNSPAGVSIQWAGNVAITELTGLPSSFSGSPQVGILSSNVALAPRALLASNVAVSAHLINVGSVGRLTQQYLRLLSSGLPVVTESIYRVLPDAFDFLVFFSPDKIELLPSTATPNFHAGLHHTVKVNYSGTGHYPVEETALWSSAGRLLGINIVDTYERGMLGQNVTHEILHQWSSYTATAISDRSHYLPRSSVGSLLGGYLWRTNGSGGDTMNCDEGRDGATHAAALDKYMMGLVPGSAVPTMRVYASSAPLPFLLCEQAVPSISATVSIAAIQGQYGVRSPGPAAAQRDFSIGFVVESSGRLLSPIEMTFYEQFATHYTRRVPAGDADPHMGRNWPPIERYFGEGTTWRSDVLGLVQPRIDSIRRMPQGRISILGTGYPGRAYSFRVTTNFQDWLTVTNQVAGTNGSLSMVVDATTVPRSRFVRLAWP